MAALNTVADYVGDSRTLLQDVIAPYRYDDPSLLVALNVAMLEIARTRGDLLSRTDYASVPSFSAVDGTSVNLEQSFRLALVFGICAHALARDQEDAQDARATMFMNNFYSILLGTRLPGLGGAGGQQPPPAPARSGAPPGMPTQ